VQYVPLWTTAEKAREGGVLRLVPGE
jgi:hypothetical protein